MSTFPDPEDFTADQIATLEQAELLIINARKEAMAMLERAGIAWPDDPFGRPCTAHIEGFGRCPCNNYRGNGEPCRNKITVDPAFPPFRSCGHAEEDHLHT